MSDRFFERIPPPRKVAIVRASRIGDFICATPAFRALRAALPQAEITLIALPLMRDLAIRSPHLDRFVAFPGFPGIAEQFFDARRALAFFAEMQAERFDLAIQLHGSGVYANPFTLMLGAQATVGFIRQSDSPGRLDAVLPFPEQGHEVSRMLALPIFLGAQQQGEQTEFLLWPEERETARALLAQAARPLISLHPGAREAGKCWPAERFAKLGATLWQRYGGTLVVIGGADEQPAAELIAQACGAPCLNLAGRTSLPELGAVVEQLALLVTNDSGPAHVAYALGTPTVTLFATTDPARWGPPATPRHRVLQAPPADQGTGSIATITVDEVAQAAEMALMDAKAHL